MIWIEVAMHVAKSGKKLYNDYKSDYIVNGTSGSQRSSKYKYNSIIDSYMHDRANVLKHIHGSATDEDHFLDQD
jgi:hypothetical protein